jgi:hypothetical protein
MAGLGWCYVRLDACADARPLFEEALGIDPYLEVAKEGLTSCSPADKE